MTQLPILIVTSEVDENSLTESFKAGANDFISKPLSKAVLECRVRALTALRKHHTELINAHARIWQHHRMEALGSLTSGISHNFNNFLAVIRSGVELLHTANQNQERRDDYYRQINEAISSACDITAQLESIMQVEHEIVCSNPISVIQAALSLAKSPGETNIVYDLKVEGEIPALSISASDLMAIIVQIVSNARQAIEGQGKVNVNISNPNDGFILCKIKDSGRGIPQHPVHRIFEPFTSFSQGNSGMNTAGTNHTGLGLFVTYNFITRAGGEIFVTETGPKGTTIEFSLPYADPRGS